MVGYSRDGLYEGQIEMVDEVCFLLIIIVFYSHCLGYMATTHICTRKTACIRIWDCSFRRCR